MEGKARARATVQGKLETLTTALPGTTEHEAQPLQRESQRILTPRFQLAVSGHLTASRRCLSHSCAHAPTL